MTDEQEPATTADGPELGYEEARVELVEVVRRLEAGGTTLEESLELWERGEALADLCQRWLDGARHRLDEARTRNGAADGSSDDATGRGRTRAPDAERD